MATRQQERSGTTRARLMDAAVACLVERGWAGTTTGEVARRAGVSRGAQLHHYPTRAELVVAAVQHLGAAWFAEARSRAAALAPGSGRTRAVLGLLADLHTGPLFRATLEVWVAARTDAALRAVVAPLEAGIGRETHRLTVELLAADEGVPGVRVAIQQTLDLVRGLGLSALLAESDTDPDGGEARRRRHLLDDWADHVQRVVSGQGRSGDPAHSRAPEVPDGPA